MLSLGALAFVSPWLLLALAGLPVLWWLLRVTPPAPRQVRFPAIRLLFRLPRKEETPAHTPWWLLLLRLAVAALIIVGLAQPVLNPREALPGGGPLVLAIDNGWSAAPRWSDIEDTTDAVLDQAERAGRPVIVLPTARAARGAPIPPSRLLSAADARDAAASIEPRPWPADYAAAADAVSGLDPGAGASVVWLADGVAKPDTRALEQALGEIGPLVRYAPRPGGVAVVLRPPEPEGAGLTLTGVRAPGAGAAQRWVRAVTDEGAVAGRVALRFDAGEERVTAVLDLPSELRNRVTRVEFEDEASAGAVVLVDERWRRRPVGLVADRAFRAGHPLLSELYYVDQALAPYAEVRSGPIEELLKRPLAVMVMPDTGVLGVERLDAVESWIEGGGVLVRFAGPLLAESGDDFTPVPLRLGDRSFGGAMSWTEPLPLAPFGEDSPFAGLDVSGEVTVERQVLAEPGPGVNERTWARLEDGTPIVTAARRGEGWLVLFHTTANTEWSNLPISGLFVEMLRRVVRLSQGVAGEAAATGTLAPLSTLDGFGRLQPAPSSAEPIQGAAFEGTEVGPGHPPGFYGSDTARRSLNLSAGIDAVDVMPPLAVGDARGYGGDAETDLRPWLIAAALLLALVDAVIALAMRGLLIPAGRATAAGFVLALGLAAALAPRGAEAMTDDEIVDAISETRLAYIETGNREIDRVSHAGLRGLSIVLRNRTSVEPGEPIAIDPAQDPLVLFPLIYWPVTPGQAPLGAEAAAKVNDYIRSGGILVFDLRGEEARSTGPSEALQTISRGLEIPPLAPVDDEHVLTKTFYLLQDFPGRWVGGKVWVERGDRNVNDGVSSVVVGTNDWASAWASDDRLRPLFAVVPGGEGQREHAYRTGVNLVMYALTGNYKDDQVHLPAIIRRLGQ